MNNKFTNKAFKLLLVVGVMASCGPNAIAMQGITEGAINKNLAAIKNAKSDNELIGLISETEKLIVKLDAKTQANYQLKLLAASKSATYDVAKKEQINYIELLKNNLTKNHNMSEEDAKKLVDSALQTAENYGSTKQVHDDAIKTYEKEVTKANQLVNLLEDQYTNITRLRDKNFLAQNVSAAKKEVSEFTEGYQKLVQKDKILGSLTGKDMAETFKNYLNYLAKLKAENKSLEDFAPYILKFKK